MLPVTMQVQGVAMTTNADDYMPWRDQTVLDIVMDNIWHDERGEEDVTS